jgi:hypothetical protein
MNPDKPHRGKLPSIEVDLVADGAVRELRRPDEARTLPPPNDPRAAPRTSMLGAKPPVQHRPAVANPPPPESIRPPPRATAVSAPDGHVTLGKGPWSLSMPSVVALAIIASVGGFATAWINKPNAGDPAEIVKAIRLDMVSLREELTKQNAAIAHRQDATETKVDRVQDATDRLRERFNERFAQPAPPVDPLSNRMNQQLAK